MLHVRAVYDAKCGRPQRGRGLVKCGHLRTAGYEKGSFFADVLYGRPPTRLLQTSMFLVVLEIPVKSMFFSFRSSLTLSIQIFFCLPLLLFPPRVQVG